MKPAVTAIMCTGLLLGAPARAFAWGPCSVCGPDEDGWVDSCIPAGPDDIDQSKAVFGIYLPDGDLCDGDPDNNYVVYGSATMLRGVPTGGVIDTEIESMLLTGSWITLVAGAGQGTALTRRSLGTIEEQSGTPEFADSSFAVYFEVDVPGIGLLWNHDPFNIAAVITCVPPAAEYIHPEGECVALYDDPDDGQGTVLAYLGDAKHITYPPIPTVSEWGLVVMTLLVLAAGTVVLRRARALHA